MPLYRQTDAIRKGELPWPESHGSKRWSGIQTMGLGGPQGQGLPAGSQRESPHFFTVSPTLSAHPPQGYSCKVQGEGQAAAPCSQQILWVGGC